MSFKDSSRPQVLIADDDHSILGALGALLESEGFDVVCAADGHAAVEKFRENRPDIVLLDLNMPVRGGWDTFERLTAIDPILPIIIITARPDAYPTAVAAGAAALMHKPLDILRLLEAMRDFLGEPTEQRLARLTSQKPPTHLLA